MAIVKLGTMVVGIRGTIGGNTFSANKAGPFVKSWSKGANPATTDQSDARNTLVTFASDWRDLTQAERDGWDTYAALAAQDLTNSLGETYSISGFNWYIRINVHLDGFTDPARTAAPTNTRPIAPTLVIQSQQRYFTTGSTTDSAIKFLAASPVIAEAHVIKCRIFGQGRLAVAEGFVLVRIADVDGGGRINIQSQLEAKFGTILANTRLFVEAFIQDDQGQRGPVDTEWVDVDTD